MSTNSASNVSSTATTSRPAPAPETEHKDLSESEFLAQQAAQATEAMAKVWQDIKAKFGEGVDPRQWTKEYPWWAVGGAALAGFLAASAAIPSKEQQALKKLERIERAVYAAHHDPEHGHGGNGKAKPSFLGTIARELLHILQPLVTSALGAGVGAVTSRQASDSDGSGGNQGQPDQPQ